MDYQKFYVVEASGTNLIIQWYDLSTLKNAKKKLNIIKEWGDNTTAYIVNANSAAEAKLTIRTNRRPDLNKSNLEFGKIVEVFGL